MVSGLGVWNPYRKPRSQVWEGLGCQTYHFRHFGIPIRNIGLRSGSLESLQEINVSGLGGSNVGVRIFEDPKSLQETLVSGLGVWNPYRKPRSQVREARMSEGWKVAMLVGMVDW